MMVFATPYWSSEPFRWFPFTDEWLCIKYSGKQSCNFKLHANLLTSLAFGFCLVHLTREYEGAKQPAEVQIDIMEKTGSFNLFIPVNQKKK